MSLGQWKSIDGFAESHNEIVGRNVGFGMCSHDFNDSVGNFLADFGRPTSLGEPGNVNEGHGDTETKLLFAISGRRGDRDLSVKAAAAAVATNLFYDESQTSVPLQQVLEVV